MCRPRLQRDRFVEYVAVVAGLLAWWWQGIGWAIAVGLVTWTAGAAVPSLAGLLARYRALPPAGSPERPLVVRARSAIRTARRLRRSAPRGPIAERFEAVERRLEASADGITRLARQSVAVRQLAAGLDTGATGRLSELTVTFAEQTVMLVGSLEAVVAGLIEVLAKAEVDPSGDAVAALERLGAEVDALRAGLDEAHRLGRQMELSPVEEVAR